MIRFGNSMNVNLEIGEIGNEIHTFKESHKRLLSVLRERQKRRKIQLEANEDLAKYLNTEKKRLKSPVRNKIRKGEKNVARYGGSGEEQLGNQESKNQGGKQEEETESQIISSSKVDNTQDGEKTIRNDYCQYFVDSGRRPQNFIRDTELSQRFDE